MRKGKSPKRRVTGTSKPAAKNLDQYLARVPEPARSTLETLRALIRSLVPPETTEVISYGIPMFKYKGGLVAFAAFSKHCSFFPMNAGLIQEFRNELKDYQTAKGTIRFPVDKPLPAPLVKKFVKSRIAQNAAKNRR